MQPSQQVHIINKVPHINKFIGVACKLLKDGGFQCGAQDGVTKLQGNSEKAILQFETSE
jgi:hypothetical protein